MSSEKNAENVETSSVDCTIESLFADRDAAREAWKRTENYRQMKRNNADGNAAYENGWFSQWLTFPPYPEVIELARESRHD